MKKLIWQKQANYFEINRISTVLKSWPLCSFLGSSVVAEYLNEANKLNKQITEVA